jgi:hypothetical protein
MYELEEELAPNRPRDGCDTDCEEKCHSVPSDCTNPKSRRESSYALPAEVITITEAHRASCRFQERLKWSDGANGGYCVL